MYATIYAPTGEMFEVPEERAGELILKGWTRSRIITVPFEPETPVQEFDIPDGEKKIRYRTVKGRIN